MTDHYIITEKKSMEESENLVVSKQSKVEKKHNRLRICIIGQGTNKHFVMPYEPNKDITVEFDKTEYKVEVNKVFVYDRGIFEWLKDKLNIYNRIKNCYMVFFKQGVPEPLTFKDAPESKITAINLGEVVYSRVIGLGVASLFKKKFGGINMKVIILVVAGIAIVVALFFAYQSGAFKSLFGGSVGI